MQPARDQAKARSAAASARAPPNKVQPLSTAAALQRRIGNGGMRQLAQAQAPSRGPVAPAKTETPAAAALKGVTGAAKMTVATVAPAPLPPAAKSAHVAPGRTGEPAAPPKAAAHATGGAGPGAAVAAARGAPQPAADGRAASTAAPEAKTPAPPPAGRPGQPVEPQAMSAPAGPAAAFAPAAAAASPALAALQRKVATETARQADVPPAGATVAQAQAAAVAPGPAAKGAAAAAAVDSLSAARDTSRKVETDLFRQKLRAEMERRMPKPADAEQAQASMATGTAQQSNETMRGELRAQQANAVGALPAAAAAAPKPEDHPQPPAPALAPAPPPRPPAIPDAAGAVPPPVQPGVLDTSADKQALDAKMAGANVTEDQLARANEPSFAAASAARAGAAQHSAAEPAKVRADEAGLRADAKTQAAGVVAGGLTAAAGVRIGALGRVQDQKSSTKDKDEAKRREISERLDGIQTKVRAEVGKILDGMETEATRLFDSGLAEALAAFDAEREKMERKARLERAQDWAVFGLLGALAGYFASLDKSEVDAAVAAARTAFQTVVERTIDRVADFVGTRLGQAKAAIDAGRAEADSYVKSLPASVRSIGAEALGKVSAELDKLAGEVDSRRDALIDKLGESYAAASQAVEDRVSAFREANKSLWDRAKEAVAGVIKTILEIKAMLAKLAAKAANVVDLILADPIQFLRNLIAGVKQGLGAFVDNFLAHLKAGFLEWLFGVVAQGGVQLPKKWDAAGIFGLIASVLGLTYANIRARVAAKAGPQVVAAIETGVEVAKAGFNLFMLIREKGFAGLWDMLVEKLAEMKDMVLEQIQSMLMTEVIKAGVTWLIGMLNPASAFVKAAKAIYDIVTFFIEKGRQIYEFVSAVVDSLGAIAVGQIGGAAKMVENALARTIPLVIGFLASLLGLGGLSKKIETLVKKVQGLVNKGLDWLIDKVIALVKKAWGAIKGLFGKKDKEEKGTGDPQKDAKVEAGLADLEKIEKEHETSGKISKDQAKKAAMAVRLKHPIFKSVSVVDGGGTWDFVLRVNPEITKTGGPKGPSKSVEQGIARLSTLVQSEKIPWQYRNGLAAQLERAKTLAKAGRLVGVEVSYPLGIGRVDFELIDPVQIVEYKFWTQKYTDLNIAKLFNQLKKYLRTGKPVVLELAITKTSPISIAFVAGRLQEELNNRGLSMSSINLIEGDTIISAQITETPQPTEGL